MNTSPENVEIPVDWKFLTVISKSVPPIVPLMSISLNVAIPTTFKLSRFKLSVPSKL